MIRTNQSFLAYANALYQQQEHKQDIVLKHFSKGQRLLCQNETATKVMLVLEGVTKCFFTEQNDKEYLLEFLGKGEIIGEIECIKDVPCLCSIEAVTEVTVYAFSLPFFQFLLKNNLEVNALLLDVFAGRIVNTASRASYQQLYTLEHSLVKLLQLQAKHDMSLSKEDMASYLGISVRSLNRGLKKVSM